MLSAAWIDSVVRSETGYVHDTGSIKVFPEYITMRSGSCIISVARTWEEYTMCDEFVWNKFGYNRRLRTVRASLYSLYKS